MAWSAVNSGVVAVPLSMVREILPIDPANIQDVGAKATMVVRGEVLQILPLASLIGSGMGILNPWNLRLIIDNAKVPVIVDAGVGTASDATIAMELGCDGVLMNTAIAHAKNPILMASAMQKGVEAGRVAGEQLIPEC